MNTRSDNMDMMAFVYFGMGIITGACLTFSVMAYRFRKERSRIIDRTLQSYLGILNKTVDNLNDVCPKWAYSCGGKACNKLDTANIVRYGKCTNYEEKRF